MSDLISRGALLSEFQNPDLFNVTEKHLSLIRNAPTVDALPVVHGRWCGIPLNVTNDKYGMNKYNMRIKCTNCGFVTSSDLTYAYCPNCGADMREGKK